MGAVQGVRTERGELVSAARLQRLSPSVVAKHLTTDGYDASRVRFGVVAFRLRYRTVDPEGHATTATGLIVLPIRPASRGRVVVFMHGTTTGRDEAPSVDDAGRSDEGLLFGSAGYAVVAPDYLGLGRGPGLHPYLHTRTETSAALDLLWAAKTFAADRHRRLDHRVLVTGFSQGGQAAMALSKHLVGGAGSPYRLRAAAPVSGVYHMRDAEIPAALSGSLEPSGVVFNAAYFLTAWDRLYGLHLASEHVFRSPYDTRLGVLYDGHHNGPAVLAELPGSLHRLLNPRGLDLLRNPDPPLASALAANDATCTGWTSTALVRLYVSRTDEQVAPTNTEQCAGELRAAGVRPHVTVLGPLDHFASERAGLADALNWFLLHSPPS